MNAIYRLAALGLALIMLAAAGCGSNGTDPAVQLRLASAKPGGGGGSGPAWQKQTVRSGGAYPQAAMTVNGNPAILYSSDNGSLRYLRASDASGSLWPTTGTIVLDIEYRWGATMAIVDGRPAVVYCTGTSGNYQLRYMISADANGEEWDVPQTLFGGSFTLGTRPQLVNAGGLPLVLYYASVNGIRNIYQMRGLDAGGSSWEAPSLVAADCLQERALVVNGNPAVTYHPNSDASQSYLLRANDAEGSSWPATGTLLPGNGSGGGLYGRPLINVGGNPAICFGSGYSKTAQLNYVRATNANGSAWGGTVVVYKNSSNPGERDMALVGGKPAIAFASSLGLQYVGASDALGSAWQAPTVVESTGYDSPYILDVGGKPALIYGKLDSNGLWTVVFAIYQ